MTARRHFVTPRNQVHVIKSLFWAGLLLLVLGITSIFVPIPQRETQGIKAGDFKIGVETEHRERVSPVISAALILAGSGLMIAGRRRPRD